MAQTTKALLFDSFKKLLNTKPISKITITDITDGIGVNRHTFYYHFKDLNGLMSWGFDSTLEKMLSGFSSYEDLVSRLKGLMSYAVEEKTFILTLYHSDLREHLVRLITDWTDRIAKVIVVESGKDYVLREGDLEFVSNFFKFGISGLVIDWLDGGMMLDPERFATQITTLGEGGVKEVLGKYALN